jgi:hypothetical protein
VGKHVTIALGTLALTAGIAASGCSGGSDADAESSVADAESPAADAESPVDSSEFRAEFKERFGVPPNEESPSWYRHITAINMGNRYLEITTDLGPKQGETALAICREAAGIALDFGIEGAKVKGSDGVGLVGCA